MRWQSFRSLSAYPSHSLYRARSHLLYYAHSARNVQRHCHYFQEVIQLSDGDEIAVAQCAYGHEGDRSWREQLHVENRFVEFDTRIGHLSFVVLA
jgi:hypothetical protein